MNPDYRINNLDDVYTPALVFYRSIIASNIAEIVRIAGSPQRLCPHVKTHKTKQIAQMQLAAGITTHKCATVAEAEMLAQIDVPDILIAYPIVGPNVRRVRDLTLRYPRSHFGVLCDHPDSARALNAAFEQPPIKLKVLMDLDVGQHRTGIAAGPAAADLYALLSSLPNLRVDGFHVYDGHNHQEDLAVREAAVRDLLAPVLALRKQVEERGLVVPRVICGGTPTFTIWAKMDFPGLQCSPGTFVLYDHGYGSKYKDLAGLRPAAVVVSRLVSKPMPGRLTFDLGHKAIAADPPAGKRCVLLNLPEFTPVLQNEEHFTIDTPEADSWNIGDVAYAVPSHICPTVALHRRAVIVENNEVVDSWEIASRDRLLTI